MTLADIKVWCTIPGRGNIGHVVMSTQENGFTFTACGTMTTGATVTTERPKRICRRCREAIPKLHVVEGTR